MSAIISIIMGFIGKIFTDIFIEQLKTPAESFEIIDEVGTIEIDSDIDEIINDFKELK